MISSILAALVTIIGMTEPAPDCRLVRERPFEGRSSESITDAEQKMAAAAKAKGADTVHLIARYRRLPGTTRVARGLAYVCRAEAAEGGK